MEAKNAKQTKKMVSSKDVAKLAGVSQSTVSRAYSPSYNLNEELRQRVFAAAEELQYFPNAIASSLLSNHTNIIAIVTSTLATPFISKAISLMVTKLQEKGLQTLLFLAKSNSDIDTVADKLFRYRVDAVIGFGARSTTRLAQLCSDRGTPLILFNRYIPQSNASAVCCSDLQCGQLIAKHLYKTGCRKFAYIEADASSTTSTDRKLGYMTQLNMMGINDLTVVSGGYTYEEGMSAIEEILKIAPDVDACFCSNDLTALGVLDYLKYHTDKKVPEDISVVGFDNIPGASMLSYNLTTVHQPIETMIDVTIEMIYDAINNEDYEPSLKIIEGKFLERDTTRKIYK